MKTNLCFDYNKIPFDKDFNLRVVLRLKGDEKTKSKRLPLNLSLVLDHSGSMSGEKLEFVKSAAINLFQRLEPNDVFSLIVFDDEIHSLIKPTRVSSLDFKNVQIIINEIRAGRTTNLSGGFEHGFEFCSEYKSESNISRIILLSDGLANVGITDIRKLKYKASEYFENGVSTSTIGVGLDYDEDLMVGLAESGNGNSYYIENPSDAESVFGEELSYLMGLCATKAKITVHSKIPGLSIGQLTTYEELSPTEYIIGDIYCEREKNIIFEFGIPAHNALEKINFADLEIIYDKVSDNDKIKKSEIINLEVEIVDLKDFELQIPDSNVLKDIALILIARSKKEARREALNHRFDNASSIFDNIILTINSMNIQDKEVIQELEKLENRSLNIKNQRENYFDSKESKRYMYEAENISKGKKFAYDAHNARIFNNINSKGAGYYLVVDINANEKIDFKKKIIPRLVQFAWILTDSNLNILEESNNLIKPVGFDIPPESVKFHGITKQNAEINGLFFNDVIRNLTNRLVTIANKDFSNITILAHNIDYFMTVLNNELRIAGITNIPFNGLNQICIRRLSLKVYGVTLLSELYKRLFNSPVSTHNNPLKDAKVIIECFKKLKLNLY